MENGDLFDHDFKCFLLYLLDETWEEAEAQITRSSRRCDNEERRKLTRKNGGRKDRREITTRLQNNASETMQGLPAEGKAADSYNKPANLCSLSYPIFLNIEAPSPALHSDTTLLARVTLPCPTTSFES